MIPPYQLVCDIWAGNPEIDPVTLKLNGVTGMIVRLNSMSGGHHVDGQFTANWAKAQAFPVQAIYFVYNPWVSGRANYDWLAAHLPADYGSRRIFADVEVRRTDIVYAPAVYAQEVAAFLALVAAAHPVTVYSGGGYLDILTPWPKNVDYWWAGYPSALDECEDWSLYRRILEKQDYATATHLCPGKARMWQCSGDSVDNLPGFGGHAVDVSAFPGTLADLKQWFGVSGETESMWTNNAIGLYTKSAGWANPAFNFVVGYAGGDWSQQSPGVMVLEPNPALKPIEEQAHAEGKPFLALWDFDVSYYAAQQYDAHDATWPSESGDYPLQSLINALKNRAVDGLIVRVMNRKNALTSKDEGMTYVAFAAKKFIERANKWLYTTKGLDKWTFVLTSDSFLRTKDSDGVSKEEYFYTWLKDWYVAIEQPALLPLASGAWPQDADKIKAVPPSLGWKFWYHYSTAGLKMMIFNGKKEDLTAFLGTTTPPPVVDPPVTPPSGDYVTRAEFEAEIEELRGVVEHMREQLHGA